MPPATLESIEWFNERLQRHENVRSLEVTDPVEAIAVTFPHLVSRVRSHWLVSVSRRQEEIG
jgi:hypothetical protein